MKRKRALDLLDLQPGEHVLIIGVGKGRRGHSPNSLGAV